MPKLLDRFECADALKALIREAKSELVLISPYFKLNDDIRSELLKLKEIDGLKLIVVYGKNEEDKRKSLSDEDLAFFKSFKNVEIRYHKRLHAKIYLNEEKCLITSLNLHDYSLRQNIEVGILTKNSIGSNIKSFVNAVSGDFMEPSLDDQAAGFAEYIVEKSTCEFEKKQKSEKAFFGLFTDYSGEGEVVINKSRTGYCIRTKEVIPLSQSSPYSRLAYQSWSRFKNDQYAEKYCHGCGKFHAATMARPFCFDCFKTVKSR
jgi:phosphatidylserine/phosphatidylglycerophosphate/cardiolipin synthase-like enzyme